MNAFDRLTELIPPPARPVRGRGDWAQFAVRNGFEAPMDYRRLIETYGVGEFGVFLVRLLEPFHPDQSLVEASEWDRQNLEGQRRAFLKSSPDWPIWPVPGGFLPWASTADGDLIGWGTAGQADDWPPVQSEVTVRIGVAAPTRVLEAALAGLAGRGIGISSYGGVLGDPRACEISIFFPPELEPVAKAEAAAVARTLGGPVLDCHDLRHQRIWPDL